MTFLWTDDAIAELRKCIDANMSAGATSLHLSDQFDFISRNGVLGKAFRLGIQFGAIPMPKRPKAKGKPRPDKRMNWSPRGHKAPQPPTHVFTGDPTEITEAQRKSILTLGNEHCRWPYGEPGRPDFFFCGAPEADCGAGRPYCAAHSAMAYNKRSAA